MMQESNGDTNEREERLEVNTGSWLWVWEKITENKRGKMEKMPMNKEVPLKTGLDVVEGWRDGFHAGTFNFFFFTCSYVHVWHLKHFAALGTLPGDRLIRLAGRGVDEGCLGGGLLNVELLQLGLALLGGSLGEEAV